MIIILVIIMTITFTITIILIMMTMTMVTLWSSNEKRVRHKEWVGGAPTNRSGMLGCTAHSIKLPA